MSSLLYQVMKTINYRSTVEKRFFAVIETGKRRDHEAEPFSAGKLVRNYQISTDKVLDTNVFTISPRSVPNNKVILYFHGGAYLHRAVRQHWNYIYSLIRQTGCTVVFPDYPLAPQNGFAEVFRVAESVCLDLVKKVGARNVILMGDSAGGGIALALAQKLRDNQLEQPGHIILLSPWLDITMTNPGIPAIAEKDPFLPVKGLRAAGLAYAKGLPLTDPLVSPVYGDCRKLGKLTLFTGTYDILSADAKKLKSICDGQGIEMNYFEYPKMLHVWMILGFPESGKVIAQIGRIISEDKQSD